MEKHEYERINNLLRTLMNRNSTTYSEISKNSENITSGSCTLTIDTIRKCFIFKINGISHPICLYPSEKKISNIKYINEISVDDLLTISNFFKHPQLIEFFKGFASKIHSHEISDINNLQNQLDFKALKTDLNNYYTKIFIDDTFVLKTTLDILNTKIATDINNIINIISKINDLLKYLAINNEDIENEFYEINIPIKVNEINDMKVIDLLTPDKIKNNQELQNLLRGQQGIQGIPGIQGEKGERGPQGPKGDDASDSWLSWLLSGLSTSATIANAIANNSAITGLQSQIATLAGTVSALGITVASLGVSQLTTTVANTIRDVALGLSCFALLYKTLDSINNSNFNLNNSTVKKNWKRIYCN